MALWLVALLWAGTFAVQYVLRPRQQKPQNARPSNLTDFSFPTADEGRAIPAVFGTRLVRGANIAWYGDFSTTPIVDAGVTVGYKYYLGTQYVICLGPVDAIDQVRFNEVPVGSTVNASTTGIRFGYGAGPYSTANIEQKSYGSPWELALAAENAMKATLPDNWKVTFGFRIDERNNHIVWGVKYSGVYRMRQATIPTGSYASGADLASAIAAVMQAAEAAAVYSEIPNTAGSFFVSYSGGKFHFAFDPPVDGGFGFEGWGLFGASDGGTFSYSNTINSTIGYRMDIRTEAGVVDWGDPGAVLYIADGAAVTVNRFIFALGGSNGTLACTDVLFTAAALLGLSTGANKTGLGVVAGDVNYVGLEGGFTLTTDYLQVDVNAPNLFGTEGGVTGRMDVYFGKTTQAACDYLATKWGVTAPGFRGICYAVARGMYVGNTNYPKPPSWVVVRFPNELGLTDGRHIISYDANPACILYLALTDQRWGLGLPASQIDIATFIAAGNTLFDEGMGLSPIYELVQEAWDFALDVLKQIDGFIGTDPRTGLIVLKLIRWDYDLALADVVDDDNTLDIKVTRGSFDETSNVVKVRYVDRKMSYTERVVQEMDIANIQARGGDQAVEEVTVSGISTEANARSFARRMLNVLAQGPESIQITMNRSLWRTRPGEVFRLDSARLGISAMPCRVTSVRAGEVNAGEIVLDAVRDVVGPAFPALDNNLTGYGNVYGFDYGGL